MRRIIGLIVPVVSLLTAVAHAQTTQTDEKVKEKRWTCAVTTDGVQLVYSKYRGGDWADIHIAPYSRSGSYKVAKEGDLAKGKTSNGTEFVCKLA